MYTKRLQGNNLEFSNIAPSQLRLIRESINFSALAELLSTDSTYSSLRLALSFPSGGTCLLTVPKFSTCSKEWP